MTRIKWKELSEEEQNLHIALLCGYQLDNGDLMLPSMTFAPNNMPPDYLNDLNAMHEAEKCLVRKGNYSKSPMAYRKILLKIMEQDNDAWLTFGTFATAAQKAEAFVLTMDEE